MTRLTDRAIIRLSATDPAEDVSAFLQGLVTNDMGLLNAHEPLWAGLLSPQGKALFDFIIWRDGADLLLDCEAEQAEALAKRLSLYRLRRKIEIGVDDRIAVHWSPEAAPDRSGRLPSSEGLQALRPVLDPRLAELGERWLAPAGEGEGEGGVTADEAWRAHRLSLGVAEGVAELGSDQTLWLECNAVELHGVSFKKGCYVGQENTARMNWRQKVNRRLVVVPIDQADEKRVRISYPELGLAVEHRRIADMADLDLPSWLVVDAG